jgi:hypothetical protein
MERYNFGKRGSGAEGDRTYGRRFWVVHCIRRSPLKGTFAHSTVHSVRTTSMTLTRAQRIWCCLIPMAESRRRTPLPADRAARIA